MRLFKVFSIITVAALLAAPVTALARTHLSFSVNLFDSLMPRRIIPVMPVIPAPMPVIALPPPPPPAYYYHMPRYKRCYPRTIVKEYHHYYHRLPAKATSDLAQE